MTIIDISDRLPSLLLPWYYAERRDLPWRADREPYHVWISEIMLQQTRVEAVKWYYTRFLTQLPDIASLAACDDEVLHKLWEGLGYYSRVRNLKKAANIIMERFDGNFPKAYTDILSLPGIGEYTAGAIASIAFNKRIPAVDGNVLRVVSRLCDDATPIDIPAQKKAVRDALARIYPEEAGDFTQALMELGATVCGPNRKPDCERCPCAGVCAARENGTEQLLPVKSPKAKRRQVEMTVFILSCDGRYALEKRKESGLLAGLWQFPNCEGKLEIEEALGYVERMGLVPHQILRQFECEHIFTHIQWKMRGFYIEVRKTDSLHFWMMDEEIEKKAALPTAFRQFHKNSMQNM